MVSGGASFWAYVPPILSRLRSAGIFFGGFVVISAAGFVDFCAFCCVFAAPAGCAACHSRCTSSVQRSRHVSPSARTMSLESHPAMQCRTIPFSPMPTDKLAVLSLWQGHLTMYPPLIFLTLWKFDRNVCISIMRLSRPFCVSHRFHRCWFASAARPRCKSGMMGISAVLPVTLSLTRVSLPVNSRQSRVPA